jgi:predicted amidohydrolase
MRTAFFILVAAVSLPAQQPSYDLLLKDGHVIDPKNNISKVMDVAIAGGKITRVGENIPAAQAKTVANVGGLYVTPGLVDIHVHVYTGTALRASMSTINPARQIKRPQLGNLDPGAEADVSVLRLDKGNFGLLDSAGARYPGKSLLAAEMTIRKGEVVWDLNGRATQDWKDFPYRRRSAPQ